MYLLLYCFVEVTTIEGVIDRSVTGLEQDQAIRRIENAEIADEIDVFITKLKCLKDVEKPFTVVSTFEVPLNKIKVIIRPLGW